MGHGCRLPACIQHHLSCGVNRWQNRPLLVVMRISKAEQTSPDHSLDRRHARRCLITQRGICAFPIILQSQVVQVQRDLCRLDQSLAELSRQKHSQSRKNASASSSVAPSPKVSDARSKPRGVSAFRMCFLQNCSILGDSERMALILFMRSSIPNQRQANVKIVVGAHCIDQPPLLP